MTRPPALLRPDLTTALARPPWSSYPRGQATSRRPHTMNFLRQVHVSGHFAAWVELKTASVANQLGQSTTLNRRREAKSMISLRVSRTTKPNSPRALRSRRHSIQLFGRKCRGLAPIERWSVRAGTHSRNDIRIDASSTNARYFDASLFAT